MSNWPKNILEPTELVFHGVRSFRFHFQQAMRDVNPSTVCAAVQLANLRVYEHITAATASGAFEVPVICRRCFWC